LNPSKLTRRSKSRTEKSDEENMSRLSVSIRNRPKKSSDRKNKFDVKAKSVSKKEAEARSEASLKRVPKEKKLLMYREMQSLKKNLYPNALKRLKRNKDKDCRSSISKRSNQKYGSRKRSAKRSCLKLEIKEQLVPT